MIEKHPPRKMHGKVASVWLASGADFVSQPVDTMPLTYEGIRGDFHAGLTCKVRWP